MKEYTVEDYREFVQQITQRCEDLAALRRVFGILDRAVYGEGCKHVGE